MIDAFELLGRAARVLEAIPVAARIGVASKVAFVDECPACRGRGAVVGPDGAPVACACVERRAGAVRYLLQHGWREGIDLARPGLGTSIATSLQRARAAATETRQIVRGPEGSHVVVEGQFRELGPWDEFQRDLAGLTWGSIGVFGAPGTGKTMTLLRLAEVLARRSGYPIEVVQMYWEDAAAVEGVTMLSTGAFVRRIALLGSTLRMPDDEQRLADGWRPDPARLRLLDHVKRRIILLDEAVFADFGPGSPERKALETALMQARHLEWIVVYAAQLMSHLPRALLSSGILLFKEPSTEAASWDRDDPAVRLLYGKAALAFRAIRNDPTWWRGPYADPRAWVYVLANYPLRYDGMMPIKLPGAA